MGKPPHKGTGGSPTATSKDFRPPRKPGSDAPSLQSTVAPSSSSTTSSTVNSEPAQGTAWTLEALVQAAQQMVQNQAGDPSGDSSPEKTKPEVKVIRLRDVRVCSMRSSATALVDSGATHSLRTARDLDEWPSAEEVMVQLAGSHQLPMRMTKSGTLLMPHLSDRGPGHHLQPQTIVPMGQLIRTLGYTMVWGPAECCLSSPTGEKIPLQTEGGCPQMREMEALSLIARLEDKKLEQLQNETLATQDKLALAAVALDRPWSHYLYDYVANGAFESGLRAVRDSPFFADLPGECLADLVPTAGLWSGWDIMKNIGFLSRPQRRKLWSSKKWVVHLFSGSVGHWELYKLDQNDTTVLELDVDRCAGQDITRSEVWRMLLWGAREGKVDVILGGPPGRAQQHAKGGVRDVKSLRLISRMMWLFAVAQVGRELNGAGVTKDRDVGFVLEYPEGITQEERERRLREADVADAAYKTFDERGGPATWTQTGNYWEHVQRPRWESYVGVTTVDARASFWDTRMWKAFQREGQLRTVSFDQGAMGGASRNRTTLGTNLNNLMSLDGVRVPEGDPLPEHDESDYIWAPGLVRALVVAMSFWDRDARCAPRMHAMTPAMWKDHVNSNHAVYRKDCSTCVMGRGIGRQHRRIHHPEAYVLTADVAGPLSPGQDSTSTGTLGKNLKYLLVAKYLVPKAFVQVHAGKPPPDDNGAPVDESGGSEVEDLFPELFGKEDDPGDLEKEHHAEVEVIPKDQAEEELDYEPSEPDQEEHDEMPVETTANVLMRQGDCDPPEMTYLVFGTALPNNQSATVKRALQDVVLYLQMHGLPVYRFHSDKGEFYNHHFRTWLRDQGVYGTWSEPK